MSNQQSGLRFDIYERVHLPEEYAAIEQFNEIELIPQIQVIAEGDQAVLKGNLLLQGQYESDGENRSILTLTHLIPVEITLPMNRVQNLEQISVGIDNFDVDLLSSRSLNVTGVLSLNGIQLDSMTLDAWHEDEEVIFVHHSEDNPIDQRTEETSRLEEKPDDFDELDEQLEGKPEEEINEEFDEVDETSDQQDQNLSNFMENPSSLLSSEEKKQLKIAFGSKKAVEAANPATTSDLKSLLHKSSSLGQADARNSTYGNLNLADEPDSSVPKVGLADSLEWKKLFLNVAADTQQFRKVRMCIVQKADTLESIANKYELKPQEIKIYNRLSEQEIREGQIIYIP